MVFGNLGRQLVPTEVCPFYILNKRELLWKFCVVVYAMVYSRGWRAMRF